MRVRAGGCVSYEWTREWVGGKRRAYCEVGGRMGGEGARVFVVLAWNLCGLGEGINILCLACLCCVCVDGRRGR